jgi:hypothetical protein
LLFQHEWFFGYPFRFDDLVNAGAEKETIRGVERKIDGKPGAVGSGYVPKYGVNWSMAVNLYQKILLEILSLWTAIVKLKRL